MRLIFPGFMLSPTLSHPFLVIYQVAKRSLELANSYDNNIISISLTIHAKICYRIEQLVYYQASH